MAALLLSACASLQSPNTADEADRLSGRLVLRVDGRGGEVPQVLAAGFDLQGNATAGRLDLASPLGSMLAQARWSPNQVSLRTPDGQRSFENLDALARQMLGEDLPLAALFDWLRGRPWPQAPSGVSARDTGPGFDQLGWHVDLGRFDEGVVIAQREAPPAVSLRARVDRPPQR